MGTSLSSDARRWFAAAAIAGCLVAAGCGQHKSDTAPSAAAVAGLIQQHLGDTNYTSITFGGSANDASSNDPGVVKALLAAHLATAYSDGTIDLTPVGQDLAKHGWDVETNRAPNDSAVVYLIPTAQRTFVKVDDQRTSVAPSPAPGDPILVAYTWHYVPIGAVANYAAEHGIPLKLYEPGGAEVSLDRDMYGSQFRGSLTLDKNKTTDEWSVLEQAKPACTPSPGPSTQPTS
jgi:hypothetical protein